MADYLNVYDLNRQKSAVLQNAFEITETQELNKIYALDFKIPADDVKVQFMQPFHYVRYGDTGQLYRIIKSEREDSDTPILSVNCEHVIATLVDDLMFGAYQYGGGTVKTADVIRWLFGKQKTANWELAECDFVHRYEYNWEQENILNALYSIPKEFKYQIQANLKEFYSLLDTASSLTQSKDKNIVDLEIKDNNLIISATSLEGKGKDKINIQNKTKNNIKISFSVRYMLEALKVFKEEDIQILLNGEISPIILKNLKNEELIELILPMKTY